MAVTYAGTATNSENSGVSSLTFSRTVGSLTNGILVVGTGADVDNAVSSVTWNSLSLTNLDTNIHVDVTRSELWYRKAPSAATANVVVTYAGSGSLAASAVTYEGVDQTTTFGTVANADNQSTTATVDASAASGDMVIDVLCASLTDGYTVTAGASQTKRGDSTGGFGNRVVTSEEAGATTVTMSWSWSAADSKTWSQIAVALKQASAGKVTKNTRTWNMGVAAGMGWRMPR